VPYDRELSANHGLLLQIFDVPPAGHQPALTQQKGSRHRCDPSSADPRDGYDRPLNCGNVVLIRPRPGYHTWECANRSGSRVIGGWGWSLEGQPFVLPGVEQGGQVALAGWRADPSAGTPAPAGRAG
jgi:hypothetical protein